MAVIRDLIEGSLRYGSDGYEDERVFLITDLRGPRVGRKWDAVNHPEVPRRGDPHPFAPGATVQSVMATPHPDDNQVCRVVVRYGGDSEGTADGLVGTGIKSIEISTSTATVETTRDIDGRLLQATYEGEPIEIRLSSLTPAQEIVPFRQSSVFTAQHEVSVVRAVVTVERGLPSLAEHRRVRMRTNLTTWSGDPPFTWLAIGVDSSLSGNGKHDWRYQLVNTDDTWLFRAEVGGVTTQTDATVGAATFIPNNPSVGNGIELFHLYRSIDFNSLGFRIPT